MQTFPVVDTVPPVKPMVRRQAYRNVRPLQEDQSSPVCN